MSDPLPQMVLQVKCPDGNSRGVSSIMATCRQSDGREFPLRLTQATVHVDWETGEPVTMDLRAIGGFAADVAAGLRHLTINDRTYRLVEVDHVQPMPENKAPELHD